MREHKRLSRQARRQHTTDDWEEANGVQEANGIQPHYDCMLLQEEEDLQQCKDALYAKKWSIDHAILLPRRAPSQEHCT
jgi:hypothetical protein